MATDELLQLLQQQIQQQQLMIQAQEKRHQEQIQVLLTLPRNLREKEQLIRLRQPYQVSLLSTQRLNCGRITGRGSIHLPRHIRFRAKRGHPCYI